MKKLFSLLMMMVMVASVLVIPAWAAADDPIVVNVIPESSATGSSAEGYKMIQDWILENTGVLVNAITLDGTDDKNQKNALLNGTTRIDVWWDSNWMQYKANDMLKNMKPSPPSSRIAKTTMRAMDAWLRARPVLRSMKYVWNSSRSCFFMSAFSIYATFLSESSKNVSSRVSSPRTSSIVPYLTSLPSRMMATLSQSFSATSST